MLGKIQNQLRNFFGFSRAEANGFLLLSTLLFFTIIAPVLFKHFVLPKTRVSFNEVDEELLDSLMQEIELVHEHQLFQKKAKPYTGKAININKADASEFIKLGFPNYIAERIVKYRLSGGIFKTNRDLMKIYGIDTSQVNQILPYIFVKQQELKLENEGLAKNRKDINKKVKKFIPENSTKNKWRLKRKLDLNLASAEDLDRIYGIGPTLGRRIIEYRQLVGGFVDLNQLSEVYGLKSPALDSVKKNVMVSDSVLIRKIDINFMDAEEISLHPYISLKKAKIMVNYREHHGYYSSKEDLKSIKVLTDEEILRLLPYINFRQD